MDAAPAAPESPHARWPWQRSLQTRILLTYGAIFVIVIALLMLIIGRVVYQAQVAGAEKTLEVQAFLAANTLQDPLSGFASEFEAYSHSEHGREPEAPSTGSGQARPEPDIDEDGSTPSPVGAGSSSSDALVSYRLSQVAEEYAIDTGARVTILDPKGNPVADSTLPVSVMTNQSGAVEVQGAIRGEAVRDVRIDPTTREQTLFTATPIRQGDVLLGIVQMARPMRDVTAPARSLIMSLAAVGIVALLLAIGLTVGFTRQIVHPIRSLERASIAIAGGDLEQQVPVTTADEVGALASAFNTMVTALRDMLDQQRLFVANASHELRTPITNIKLRSEALLGAAGSDPTVSHRYLGEIDHEADRLGKLAAELLDLSSLESSAASSRAAGEVDITEVIRSAGEALRMRAQKSGLALVVSLPDSLPLVGVREEEIEEILVNLLDNALKYTPAPGEIRLSAQVEQGNLVVRVTDTGPGIQDGDLDHIFERFYRADRARSRSKAAAGIGSGAGLGLSIARALAQRNGGSIRVESRVGEGTTFDLILPVA